MSSGYPGPSRRGASGEGPPLGKMRERIQSEIDGLVDREAILGAALVSRDGIPVVSAFDEEIAERPFSLLVESAMTATLFAAAEVAMEELEAGQARRVAVETDEARMTLLAADEDLLLTVLSAADAPAPGKELTSAAARIREAMEGSD